MDQGEIAAAAESMLSEKPVRDHGFRAVTTLFDDKGQVAASFTYDGDLLSIEVSRRTLPGDMEARLEEIIEEALGAELRPI